MRPLFDLAGRGRAVPFGGAAPPRFSPFVPLCALTPTPRALGSLAGPLLELVPAPASLPMTGSRRTFPQSCFASSPTGPASLLFVLQHDWVSIDPRLYFVPLAPHPPRSPHTGDGLTHQGYQQDIGSRSELSGESARCLPRCSMLCTALGLCPADYRPHHPRTLARVQPTGRDSRLIVTG